MCSPMICGSTGLPMPCFTSRLIERVATFYAGATSCKAAPATPTFSHTERSRLINLLLSIA
jgi:hypothetical protein